MNDWIERAHREHDELQERLAELSDMLAADSAGELDLGLTQSALLQCQRDVMATYLNILERRLELARDAATTP